MFAHQTHNDFIRNLVLIVGAIALFLGLGDNKSTLSSGAKIWWRIARLAAAIWGLVSLAFYFWPSR